MNPFLRYIFTVCPICNSFDHCLFKKGQVGVPFHVVVTGVFTRNRCFTMVTVTVVIFLGPHNVENCGFVEEGWQSKQGQMEGIVI